MTRQDIENYDYDKVESISDFIAFCCYHDSDFAYEWKDYVWDDTQKKYVTPEKEHLYLWIPFDKLDIFTHQVIGFDYFDDGHYPLVNMYDGGIRIDDQEEIKWLLDWCELDTEEKVLAVFPKHETYDPTYLLSTEEAIDNYFKRLEELGVREEGSNIIIEE